VESDILLPFALLRVASSKLWTCHVTTSRYTPFPKMFAPSVSRRAGMQSQPAGVRRTDYRSLIPNHPVRARQRDPESIRGFTLLELLIVVGIIGLLMVLLAPAFNTIKGGTDVTSAAYTIKGVLETARTYAKANNDFVWVGFKEVDISQNSSVTPQNAGTGRLAIALVASKDGTRGYDVTSPSLPNPAWTNYSNGASLVAVTKLYCLENIHLVTSLPNTGNMTRPAVSSNNYIIGNAPASVTPFDWPLGSPLNAGQYSFQKVINFDPQGVARIQYSTNTNEIVPYIEIGLQQTYGTTVSSNNNVAAIQVGGITGNVTIYRP
jgi:prepilin-type N-terminal cleavage/methylation domain-containing protein